MTGRRRLGLVAAGATLLASAPLSAIFDSWTWLIQCILAVGLTAGAAVLARTMRFPLWAQAVGMVGVLLLVLTWTFPSGEEILSLIPTPATFSHFGELFAEAGSDARTYGVPVPDRDGLLFLTVLGVGGCAVAVDLLTVVLRKPALAGLPMLAIYSVPVAVYVESVPVLPFIIGAIGFLWLLVADNVDRVRRFGRRFTGDGRDVDVWEPSPLAAAGRRLALIGVVAAVLLPLAVPGMTGGLLARLTQLGDGNGLGAGAGGSGRLDLFASLNGQLNQTETRDLLKVTTNEPNPFYLRLAIADQLTERGFGNRPLNGPPLSRDLPDPRAATAGRVEYKRYQGTVEATGLDGGFAPIYSTVVGTDDLNDNWSYDANAGVVFSRNTAIRERKYSFEYLRADFDEAALRTAPKVTASSTAYDLTATPDDPIVTDLVTKLTAGKKNEYDKVRAISDWFSKKNGFEYSLSTISGTGGPSRSDIDNFLDTKTGYCQQYAAATAWMVRAAGIPARVAFGFTKGGLPNGSTYTITNRNAHAWTEVYFQGFGWVPFDTTPSSSLPGAARPDYAPDPDAPAPAPSSSAAAGTPGSTASTAPGAADRPDEDINDSGAAVSGSTTGTGVSTTTLLLIGAAALLVALLLVPSLLRRLTRRRRHAATVPRVTATGSGPSGDHDVVVTTDTARARHDAHAAWDELIDTMIDYRVPVDPTETPRHTAQRLVRSAGLTDTPATSATLLGTAEERARYARTPLQGGELTPALEAVRKALSATASRRTRLTAALLPPSVMLRWRLGVADSSIRGMGAVGRVRDFLVRFSPRRLIPHRAR